MMTDAVRKRAKLVVDIKGMTFKQTVDELDRMRRKKSEYGRCPTVIIDEWTDRANNDNATLHTWIMRQFMIETHFPKKSLHKENQEPMQEVLGIDYIKK